MDFTDLETKILKALIEDDNEKETLFLQLKDAKVKSRDYTGVGVFTEIIVPSGSPLLTKSNRYIEDVPKAHLNHPDLAAGAGVLLWFSNGQISTLELYTYDGDWPDNESLFEVCN